MLKTIVRSVFRAAGIFFGTKERFHVDKILDKRRSKNLTASLVLCFYAFFTMLLTLNPEAILGNFHCLLA